MVRLARARWLTVALVALGATAASAAGASVDETLELDADRAVREALSANRDREAALERIAVARGLLEQSGRLSNPEFEMSAAGDFAFANEGEGIGTLSFEQRFPVTARLARERDVAQSDVEIAEAEVREFDRILVADVLGAFYSALSLERRIRVKDELVGSVGQLEDVSERRLRAAEVSRVDLSLLRIERLRLAQERVRLEVERDAARLRLSRLLGKPLETPIYVRGELEPGPPEVLEDPQAWVARRPDVRAAALVVNRARADEGLARAQRWEDWTLRTWMERERSVFEGPMGAKRDRFVGMDVVVPLPLWNRNQGRIVAAAAETRRAERARSALVLRAEEELRAAQVRVATLRASADAYRMEILPESTDTLAVLEQGYRQGLMGIAELLQGQRQHAEVQDEYLELLGDLRRGQVELEAAAARSPHLGALPPERRTP